MDTPIKTNAIRMLEKARLTFRVASYEVDEEDLSGIHVAQTLGLPVEQVVKTLVLKGDRTGFLVACIPVETELDLKTLAAVSGNKSCEMISVRELLPLTGYIRGGCSPVGMKKAFPTYFDETVTLFDWISVSAGVRGAQILYAHTALQMAAGMGYLSPWAKSRFASVRGKNDFFVRLGETLDPAKPERIANVSDAMTPDEVLAAAASEDSASGAS